ncbi:hypothetical protein AKJ65_04370 [candidate division MSBL1 archaeon SCGC-AAA259E19]|uniref:Transposase IS4-like domain-containing protein n=1 Tax=candidate division MSBL1 archaeon SCGC-AAA259E19 TaxID=1698264 RepID=A0A133UJU9_9EURY|nr:hypothetical protein AKJ65_04370 [candidate division MSBL1 archaeon SCGC-AAA259E19]
MESLDISLDLVFYDLTSSYFEGEGPDLADYGYSRDNRPDKEQVVLGVVMADGIPIAHEVWAGNTVDKSTLKETVERLRERFEIGKVVFVADRGVISTPNLEELENIGYEYILSTKRRKDDLAEELLKKEIPGSERVRAKEVHREEVGDATRRYILCLDEETRKSRLETLDEIRREKEKELADLKDRYERSQSGRGPGRPMTKKGVMDRAKRILGRNKRLFKLVEDEPIDWKLDREAWEYERTIAGKFLLVTTSDLGPSATMKSYKNLKDIERAFDELKNFLKLRPFYHRTEKRLRGHVFVCILALLLKRLTEKKTDKPFQKTMQKLEKLKANAVKFRGKKFIQRNEINQPQEEVLKSLEVLKPPKILDVGAKE